MEKIYFIATLALATIFTACEDFNEKNFPGYDEAAKPANLVNYKYELVSSDYATIGNAVKKPIDEKIAKQNDLIKNNKSGFSSLPGGIRHKSDGSFEDLNTVGYWWTATLYNSVNAWMMAMGNGDSGLAENWYSRNTGLSVRCVKDY